MKGLDLIFLYLLFFFLGNSLMVESQIQQVVGGEGSSHGVQTYIVHVTKPPESGSQYLGHQGLENWHRSFLPRTALASGKPRLLYSYHNAISGFAARLNPAELESMKSMDGFLHAEPDRTLELATTYTPAFLGLSQSNGAWSSSSGEGVIIGILDSGILPTHASFNDAGMPPPPARWKGLCGFSNFSCNNKIIGGAVFLEDQQKSTQSMVDEGGHGTHVASTAAGSFVPTAEVLGQANGTASGVAPRAHLAIYKVGSSGAVVDSNVLAAIDQAIKDGVDVISMSFGQPTENRFSADSVALGSFAAINHGISIVAAAANTGPGSETVRNSAPWILTVGASSTDRRLTAVVKLGSGVELYGQSAYQPDNFNSSLILPMVYSGSYCTDGSLNHLDVKGKIVLCLVGGGDNVDKGRVVLAAGGAGMVVMNLDPLGSTTFSDAHVLPASHIGYPEVKLIVSYIQNTTTPTASIIFKGTKFGHRPAPTLAAFSARGPSTTNGGILKPDVIAPGVNILAASPFPLGSSQAGSAFIFRSGTSMATPHIAGVIALVKSKHPSWSPAAIQSAIVTTAHDSDLAGELIIDDYTGKTADISDIGSGQVDPSAALDPGIVYDLNPSNYIGYLCGLGYNNTEVTIIARRQIKCSSFLKLQPWQLNYPSISVTFRPGFTSTLLTRSVTKVGAREAVYIARITEPMGVKVRLSRHKINFGRGRRKSVSFGVKITLTAQASIKQPTSFRGKLQWISGNQVVTSPIVILYKP